MAAYGQVAASKKAEPATHRQQNGEFHFGDIVLSGYDTAEMAFGKSARATGPGSTVDTADPKLGRKGRLQANELTAFMVPKSNSEVERIEATGNVRFNGSGPAKPSGTQTFRATGSKGTYYKQKGLLELDGPVTFFSERPTADGKAKQTVNGKANHATYDDEKSLLTLIGNVQATVHTPETGPEGSSLTDNRVDVDMSSSPYVVKLTSQARGGSVNIRLKQGEEKNP